MKPSKSSLLDCLKNSKNFLIVGHYHPDGDALGSGLALSLGLEAMGKKTVVYNRDPVPFNLKFLPHSEKIVQKFPAENFDCALMVDCAQPKRVGPEFAKALEAKKIRTLVCIDHHLLDHSVGDIDWIEPEAASTGVVIWHLLKNLKVKLTKEMANLVFCTITVDTGSFKYSNTTAGVFELASELVASGADPWFVARHLEEENPPARFRLLGLCLQTLRVELGGAYACMEVTQEMLKEAQAGEDYSDEFANIPRSIAGVEAAALFREIEPGKIKVSLRSKSKVDVSRIAKSFGGGGHEHAAGCNFSGGMEEAKQKILEAVREAL